MKQTDQQWIARGNEAVSDEGLGIIGKSLAQIAHATLTPKEPAAAAR